MILMYGCMLIFSWQDSEDAKETLGMRMADGGEQSKRLCDTVVELRTRLRANVIQQQIS